MIRCAESEGWQVPQDASVIGVDNNEIICDYAPVPITSVRINFREAGYRAAELLQKVIAGDVSSEHSYTVAPAGVVPRRSTDAMGVEDTRLMEALQIIRSDYPKVLGLPELAATVGLSNNQLSRLFAQHLGRSIPEEINRVRIEAARRLLSETKESAKEIAFRCGFSSPNYFNKIFKEHTGQKPLAYRQSAQVAE
jgi:LacI family transcriptional regulator